MNVYQIASYDYDDDSVYLDAQGEGNACFSTLAKAKASCQTEEHEYADDCMEQHQKLDWREVADGTYEADSNVMSIRFVVIRTKVL